MGPASRDSNLVGLEYCLDIRPKMSQMTIMRAARGEEGISRIPSVQDSKSPLRGAGHLRSGPAPKVGRGQERGRKKAGVFRTQLPPLFLPVFSQRRRPPKSRVVNPPPVNSLEFTKTLQARVQRQGRTRERFYYIKPAFSELCIN